MHKKKETHHKIQVAQIHFIIKQQNNQKIIINKLKQKKKKILKKIVLPQNLHLLLQIIQKIQKNRLKPMT